MSSWIDFAYLSLVSGQFSSFPSRDCSLLFAISLLLGRDGSSALQSRPDTCAPSLALLKVVFSVSDNARLFSIERVGFAILTTPNVSISDWAMTGCFSCSYSTELCSCTLNPLYGDAILRSPGNQLVTAHPSRISTA